MDKARIQFYFSCQCGNKDYGITDINYWRIYITICNKCGNRMIPELIIDQEYKGEENV